MWIINRIICMFKGHDYEFAIGTQYMCDRCYKVIWEKEYNKIQKDKNE